MERKNLNLKQIIKTNIIIFIILMFSSFAFANNPPNGAIVNFNNKLKVEKYDASTNEFWIQLYIVENGDQDDSWSDDASDEPHQLKINGQNIAQLYFKTVGADGRLDETNTVWADGVSYEQLGDGDGVDIVLRIKVPDTYFASGSNNITFEGVWKERVSGDNDRWTYQYLTTTQNFPKPGPAQNLQSAMDQYGNINMRWSPPMQGDYDAVKTYRNSDSIKTYFEPNRTSAVDDSYNYGDALGVQYLYTWKDDIIDGGTAILKSDIVYTTPSDFPTPAVPSNVQATTDRCDSIIKITWDYNDNDVTEPIFHVYRNGVEISGPLSSSTHSYENNVGASFATYNYQVQAQAPYNVHVHVQGDFTKYEYSDLSEQVQGKTSGIPSAPTNLTTTIDPNSNGIILNWNAGAYGQDSYFINKVTADNSITITDIQDGHTDYTDNNVPSCVTINYTVYAKNHCKEEGVPSNTSSIRIQPDISNTFTSDKRLVCSKGYYNDKVELHWDYNNTAVIERFKIYRRELPDGNFELIATIDPTTSYDDETANPGVYYEYKIVGETDCEDDVLKSSDDSYCKDIGFKVQRGVVSGNVSYEGGNGVEGVFVLAETDDQFDEKSLYLNGSNSNIRIPNNNSFDFSENFTFQSWIKPATTDSRILFQKGNQYKVWHQLNRITFQAGSQTLNLNFPEKQDTFFCVTAMRDPDSLYIYVFYDDMTYYKASVLRTSTTPSNTNDIYIGGTSNAFEGWVEDIRIWNNSFNQTDIWNNALRYLSGSENGLKVYYHLDEQFYNQVYDISRNGSYFNENHGYTTNCTLSSIVPYSRQLAVKGITDQDGNYIITNIPFTVGSVYNIVPIYGVHEFDPHQKQLYIGPGSENHNNVDFTDIAAFKITGNVKYRGTNFPVRGAYFYIDDKMVTQANGQPITTDEYGNYEIYVPIGWHHFRVAKNGHGFADEGRFPPQGNWNFDKPITGIDFSDTTLVKVVGRCAGGPIEQSKKLGFGYTVNNIGNATIRLTTQRDYELTDNTNGVSGSWDNTFYKDDAPETYGSTNYEIASTSPDYITIYPDHKTGEFVAYLLPEKYNIVSVTAGEYTYDNSYLTALDLTKNLRTKTEIDSIVTGFYFDTQGDTIYEYEIDSVNYNKQLDMILRIRPTITVTDKNGNDFFADSIYVARTGDTIPLLNDDGTLKTAYPVFTQRHLYNLNISVFENYHNIDAGTYDSVPVTDGKVEVINQLAINNKKQTFQIDSNGQVHYQFAGGLPNITQGGIGDYLLSMSIVALTGQNGTLQTPWLPDGDVFKGYVLGGLPTGNNFVSTGPNKVVAILRDPPGSNSYAYLQKGSEITNTTTISTSLDISTEESITEDLGMEIAYGGGIAGPIIETDVEESTTEGYNISESYTSSGTISSTYTTTETWQTSAAEDFDGSGGDLFIGYSTNIVYGVATQIDLLPTDMLNAGDFVGNSFDYNGKTYDIGKTKGIRISPKFKTAFQYSQNHIENYLIPNLIMLRNKFLLQDTNIYHTVLPPDDPEFGRDNKQGGFDGTGWVNGDSYNYTIPADFPKDSTFVDSVHFFNVQIKNWKQILAFNEKEKLTAKLDKNISFDAGAIYENEQTNSSSSEVTFDYSFVIGETIAEEEGIVTEGQGITANMSFSDNVGEYFSAGESQTNTVTYGYHLEDGNAGDYLSVDVKKPHSDNGPVFITRGGQTMCPYEGGTYTKYYNPGTTLNEATMQREVPQITVNNPIASNVPEDKEATFTVNLKNISETGDNQWFILSVDEQSNQNGARIFMDGNPIGDGRMIMVPAGQAVNKVITVKKGPQDVYDYENIGIILHSACQFDPTDFQDDIADTAFITAHFIPVCTSVNLDKPVDNWVINTNTDSTLRCQISGYNLNSTTFQKILLQYKPLTGTNWTTSTVFYVNEDDYNQADSPKVFIDGQPIVLYNIDLKDVQDRQYIVKATTMCSDGTTNTSELVTGTKDVKPPKLFGSPQPADGILTPGDEISITFDEPINQGVLLPYNFSVTGVLNGTKLKHEVCLYFDGAEDYASTTAGVNLDNKSWTIEFWARRGDLNEGVVFSQNGIDLGFDASNHFYLKAGSQVITSDQTITSTDDWKHYAVTYDYPSHTFNMYINDVIEREDVPMTSGFSGNGRMYIGKNNDNTLYFNGFVHELRVWEKALGFASIYSMMYQKLIGNEVGLAGYWPMDEAHGDVAQDKARYHHLIRFGAEWRVFPTGYARTFDGNSHLSVPTGSTVVLSDLNDFTLELYFKGQHQTNTVLFSNGRGDGTDGSPAFEDIWNVGFDANGNLYAKNNGVTMTVTDKDFLDNQWHHLALVCNRASNTNLYIDGELQTYANSSQFGGLVSDSMAIGARRYKIPGSIDYDRYFKGSIDELRFWNLAKPQKQIELDMNSKLKGSEVGLLAYYPFDKYNDLGSDLIPTLNDMVTDTLSAVAQNGDFDNIDVPNIKDARPVQNLNYNWVVNNNKIIINLDEAPSTIEKCNIQFTVQRVKDLYDNYQVSPVTWTAYIKQNTVVWDDQMLNFEKEVNKPLTFTEKITNLGGQAQNYDITGLPSWLSVDEPSGTLQPDSYKILTFTVDPVVNIGNYETSLHLTSDFGYSEKLNLSLKVYKKPPNWSVNPDDYQYSMSVIGHLKIDGKFSTNPDDMIAAFVDGECRGVAKSRYIEAYDMYEVFLTIMSNQQSGEHVTFKIWNASEGYVHVNVTPEIDFVSNNIIGTPANPQVIETYNSYSFDQQLENGWNWISFNLASDSLANVAYVMKDVNATDGDQIKTSNVFANYSSTYGWNGTLVDNGGFNNRTMYMIKLANGDTLKYFGSKIDVTTTEIPINTGWNWISYTPNVNMTVNDAFGNYYPANGDVVKSQYEFAMYDQTLGWIGNLTYMVPGRGYMFKTSNPDGILTYPQAHSKGITNGNGYNPVKGTPWKLNENDYQFNMSIVAELQLPAYLSENNAIGIFANGECRGIAKPITVGKQKLYFITAYANSNEKMTFKVVDLDNNEVYDINEQTNFVANDVKGTIDNPIILTVKETSSSLPAVSNHFDPIVTVYPNPFTTDFEIMYNLENQKDVKIELYDVTGRKLYTFENNEENAGKHSISVDAKNINLQPGVYNLKFTAGDESQTIVVIKK